MKICFTSDFHGRATLYEQLDRLLADSRPDLLVLGGDMFLDGDLDDPIGTQVAFIERSFGPRLERWRGGGRMRIACILGNHDWLCACSALHQFEQEGLLVQLDPSRPWECGGVSFLGYSFTPPTPYWVKDFERLDLRNDPIPETGGAFWDDTARDVQKASAEDFFAGHPSMGETLEAVAPPVGRWIWVCHAPPYGTGLDRLPHVNGPVGSRAVRAFIERTGPLCSLHGHIHESPRVTHRFTERIGRTLCVNPGQGEERLHAVVFDSDDPAGTIRHTLYANPAASTVQAE